MLDIKPISFESMTVLILLPSISLLDRYNIKIRSQQMSSDEDNGEAVYSDSDSDIPNRESYMSGRDSYSVASVTEEPL